VATASASGLVNAEARVAYDAGLNVVPVREDGSKAPDVTSWAEHRTRRIPPDLFAQAFASPRSGLGVIAGLGYEIWDFDDLPTYHAFLEACEACGLFPAVETIIQGYEDETPAGGRRWLACYPAGVDRGNRQVLAARPREDGKPKPLIELPDHGIVAPSNGRTHPSGKPYIRRSGGFPTIASYTADQREALFELARTFDEMPKAAPRKDTPHAGPSDASLPGADFNARADWMTDVLGPHGWCRVFDRGETTCLRRPGKQFGVSATLNHGGSGLLYVFSSSTSFEPNRGYNKFGAYALLNHHEDFAAAAKELAGRGFGTQDRQGPRSIPAPSSNRVAAPSTLTRSFDVRTDGRFVLTVPEAGIAFDLDRVRRERWGDLTGELTVTCKLPGARTVNSDGVISVAKFGVSDLRTREERAKYLRERAQTNDIDWLGLLEDFCHRVLASERSGQPAVHLRDLDRPSPDEEFDVDGFRLLRRHPVILFGDGGSAKSYLALWAAGHLSLRGFHVLYADWEFAGEEHRERLERLFGQPMPDVRYARCERPLVAECERLRRIVADEQIDYAILDSIAFACDGPPEAAEVAAAYYRAVRLLGVGSLHIAHITKSEGGDQKPFGSTFWHNGARTTWYAQRSAESQDGRIVSVGLFNRKSNIGPQRPAIAFELAFEPDRTLVRRVEAASVDDFAAKIPIAQRMAHLLRGGARTIAEIAAELEAKVDSIEKSAKRNARVFTRVVGADGVSRIGLVARRGAA
jgi:hypothetical protein